LPFVKRDRDRDNISTILNFCFGDPTLKLNSRYELHKSHPKRLLSLLICFLNKHARELQIIVVHEPRRQLVNTNIPSVTFRTSNFKRLGKIIQNAPAKVHGMMQRVLLLIVLPGRESKDYLV